jgi:F-type H+-transporting ATPase subunit epsilon
MANVNFHLKVVSREGIVYEGDVSSITSYNDLGVFDVLAQHANFISLVNTGLIIREAEEVEKEIKFDNALMKVNRNQVEVYVGIEGMAPSNLKAANFSVESKVGISS